ncbi:MAG: hypothetical protein K2X87_08630 [Gemmataceae bacterium]|nr:hypothetical protein [Gemmataceae bacterium]
MTGPTVRLACAAAAVLAAAGAAAAQPPIPGGIGAIRPPAFSPYLNLMRDDGFSPGLNYFGIVRPQVEARRALYGLESQVQVNRQAIAGVQSGLAGGEYNLPYTGHPSVFLNTGGYFLNSGGRGGPFTGSGGGGGGSLGGGGGLGGSRMPTGLRPVSSGQGQKR